MGTFGPYEQYSDESLGDLSELSDDHTLDIGTFGPCVQISDESQGQISELPDDHTLYIGTFGPYVWISDEKWIITLWTLELLAHM